MVIALIVESAASSSKPCQRTTQHRNGKGDNFLYQENIEEETSSN
jgi:hypothetical protein